MKLDFVKGYYYLAPLWFLAEAFFFQDLRAGPIVGHSLAAVAVFYAAEAGIGALYWHGKPGADAAATLENVVQFIAVLKFILFAPIDAAMALDVDPGQSQAMMAHYSQAVPGAIFSGFQLVHAIRRAIGKIRPA